MSCITSYSSIQQTVEELAEKINAPSNGHTIESAEEFSEQKFPETSWQTNLLGIWKRFVG